MPLKLKLATVVLLLAAPLASALTISWGPECQRGGGVAQQESPSNVLCATLRERSLPASRVTPMVCAATAREVSELMANATGAATFDLRDACVLVYVKETVYRQILWHRTRASRMWLHGSVSELIGHSSFFSLLGDKIYDIRPEVFLSVPPQRRHKLKGLEISDTKLAAFDLSVLRRLNLTTLFLVGNVNMKKLYNSQRAQLPGLRSVLLLNNSNQLISSANLQQLPQTVEQLSLLPRHHMPLSEAQACALCALPASARRVSVSGYATALPHLPQARLWHTRGTFSYFSLGNATATDCVPECL